MNSTPHKYFLKFPMAQLTIDASPTKLCFDFYSGDNVDLEMKEIGCTRISSRDLSNSHIAMSFYCDSNFLASDDTSASQKHLSHYILVPVCIDV